MSSGKTAEARRIEARRLLGELARLAGYPAYGGLPDLWLWKEEENCEQQLKRLAATDPDVIGREAIAMLQEGMHGFLQCRAVLTYAADYGDRLAVNSMLSLVQRGNRGWHESRLLPHYFHCALRVIERHGFNAELIERFNRGVVSLSSDGEAMYAYHEASRYFAHWYERFQGEDLFGRLERGGVQLWDYWMTYGPGTPKDPIRTLP